MQTKYFKLKIKGGGAEGVYLIVDSTTILAKLASISLKSLQNILPPLTFYNLTLIVFKESCWSN
jgi:hypothetical protein